MLITVSDAVTFGSLGLRLNQWHAQIRNVDRPIGIGLNESEN